MAKLCNAAPAFFRAQPLGTGRNFTRPVITCRLQSLLCCAARALFRLKSVIVVGAKQVLTGLSHLELWLLRSLRQQGLVAQSPIHSPIGIELPG
jgi:hypothetical protein